MKKVVFFLSSFIVLLTSCISVHENEIKAERFLSIGIQYFKQNKFLEALGPFSEAEFYKKNDLTIQCYIGLCLCNIEESKRGKDKIDKYLKYVKKHDPYLLNKIGSVYGHIFKNYGKN